mmetsp:Transcript_71364/g.190591  ORF Transcript_71364/g.190591 Transcript_71364/m.190591 type:complete len:98 (+) Transcript_71364:484-777(+)
MLSPTSTLIPSRASTRCDSSSTWEMFTIAKMRIMSSWIRTLFALPPPFEKPNHSRKSYSIHDPLSCRDFQGQAASFCGAMSETTLRNSVPPQVIHDL